MLLTSPNNIQKQSDLNILTEQLIKWFKSNLLFLNFDKTYFIQFNNKSRGTSEIQINYEDKQISIANETKFLGLSINNNNLSWKTHIECIKSKLSCSLHKDTTPPQPNHTITPTHIEPEQYNPLDKSTVSRKLLKMNVLTFKTCWAVNSEIIKQVTSSWSIFIQLSSPCYAMRSVKLYVLLDTLKMIYYSYFHSVITYGLLFWGHSSDSTKIFRLQKKITRIMVGCTSSDSCRKLFFKL